GEGRAIGRRPIGPCDDVSVASLLRKQMFGRLISDYTYCDHNDEKKRERKPLMRPRAPTFATIAGACALALMALAVRGPAQAEEIAVSNFGVSANGMPY